MNDIIWLSDSQILKKIGDKLKEWRLQIDITQAEAARRCDLSLITYQKFEYGQGGTIKNFIRALRILGNLDVLSPLMQEREMTPIEYQEFEKTLKIKKRATKTK